MKNVLLVGIVIGLTGCNMNGSSTASSSAAAGTSTASGSSSGASGGGSVLPGSGGSSPKTLVQTQGCTASKGKGGGNINCSDGSVAFIPNGSPFMVQDANGKGVGDHLMSLFNGNFLVWDVSTNSMFNYSTGGDLGASNLGFASSDCSGQAYVGIAGDQNGLINTVFNTRSGTLYKATAPAETVTINSLLYSGTAYASTGGCQDLSATPIQGTFPQAMVYANSNNFQAKLSLPLSIVINNGSN